MLDRLLSASIIEKAINRALQLDPQLAEKLAPLEGKCFSVQLDFLSAPWVFRISNQAFNVVDEEDYTADVTLSGTLGGFLGLFYQDKTAANPDDKLYISGDLHTAQAFQQVMQSLQPDFRGALVQRFGYKLGGVLAEGLEQFKYQGERARAGLEEQLRELLAGSHAQALTKAQFASFKATIATLEPQLQSLEARLRALEAR